MPADAQHANRFRLFDPAFIFNGHWCSELLELFHASPGVQIRLVDGQGAPFGDTASLVDFTRIPVNAPLPPDRALRPAGAERKRLGFTETPGQPIWVELYAGDGVTPRPNLRLRRLNANSLSDVPGPTAAHPRPRSIETPLGEVVLRRPAPVDATHSLVTSSVPRAACEVSHASGAMPRP